MMKKIRCPYFELKARSFKFLGSVTVYAYMQSVGLVNDHARFCFRYKELSRLAHRKTGCVYGGRK